MKIDPVLNNVAKISPSYYLGQAIGNAMKVPEQQHNLDYQNMQDQKVINNLQSEAEMLTRGGFRLAPQKNYQQIQNIYQNQANAQMNQANSQADTGKNAVISAIGSAATLALPQIDKLNWNPASSMYHGAGQLPLFIWKSLEPRIK